MDFQLPPRKDSIHNVEFPLPPRKDSLHNRAFLNVVDQPTKVVDSTQSVTAYVSAEYTEIATTTSLTHTSWLSDPDCDTDDILAPIANGNWANGPTRARPKLGSRSQTTPVYKTTDIAPPELPDAAYERILREKLRHHAGQVTKRLGVTTFAIPHTMQGNDIETHLAFVRAAEELLKQSPVWRAGGDHTARMNYLLER